MSFFLLKKDLDNIDDDELADFRILAKAYSGLTEKQIEQLLRDKALVEICHEQKE